MIEKNIFLELLYPGTQPGKIYPPANFRSQKVTARFGFAKTREIDLLILSRQYESKRIGLFKTKITIIVTNHEKSIFLPSSIKASTICSVSTGTSPLTEITAIFDILFCFILVRK